MQFFSKPADVGFEFHHIGVFPGFNQELHGINRCAAFRGMGNGLRQIGDVDTAVGQKSADLIDDTGVVETFDFQGMGGYRLNVLSNFSAHCPDISGNAFFLFKPTVFPGQVCLYVGLRWAGEEDQKGKFSG